MEKTHQGKCAANPRVTIVYSDYLAKNAGQWRSLSQRLATRYQYGSKNKPQVAEILQKAANADAADRAAANQWDGAYIASFEPADIASLGGECAISVKALGSATKDAPDSAFDAGLHAGETDEAGKRSRLR